MATDTEPPTDPDALKLLRRGSRTVRQLVAETGIPETEWFRLMRDEGLPWFPYGGKGTRLVPWVAVVRHLAKLYAARRGETRSSRRTTR